MDIYCTRCGEPWELDTFHEVADEKGITWEQAIDAFRRDGCEATGWCDPCEKVPTARGDATAVLLELFGHDIDGVASDLADFDAFGLL